MMRFSPAFAAVNLMRTCVVCCRPVNALCNAPVTFYRRGASPTSACAQALVPIARYYPHVNVRPLVTSHRGLQTFPRLFSAGCNCLLGFSWKPCKAQLQRPSLELQAPNHPEPPAGRRSHRFLGLPVLCVCRWNERRSSGDCVKNNQSSVRQSLWLKPSRVARLPEVDSSLPLYGRFSCDRSEWQRLHEQCAHARTSEINFMYTEHD
jgi:hypothetical protein